MDNDHLNKTLPIAEIYTILEIHCGTNKSSYHEFESWALDNYGEWRFCGDLGFGGKIYTSEHAAPRVSCYPEDRTPERDAAIQRANTALEFNFNRHRRECEQIAQERKRDE